MDNQAKPIESDKKQETKQSSTKYKKSKAKGTLNLDEQFEIANTDE